MHENELWDMDSVVNIPLLQFPDGVALSSTDQPVHMIEMSARQLIFDVQKTDRLFGITTVTSDGKLGVVGTMLENTKLESLDDGSQVTWNKCRKRFQILSIVKDEPYQIIKAKYPINDLDFELEQKNLPENIANEQIVFASLQRLENEVWMLFNDVTALTIRSTSISRDILIDSNFKALNDLSPTHREINNIDIMTTFSFLMADMICVDCHDRQLLLASPTLSRRLELLKNNLSRTKAFLQGSSTRPI